jgi:sugar transferase (PEP-CTERM/EpsH1 system associated)
MLRMGGTELGVIKLVNALSTQHFVAAVCSSRPPDEGLEQMLNPRIRLLELNRRDGNDPRFIIQLARLFRRERPDIVHTHSWGTLCEGLVAAQLARVPVFIHGEHGTMETRPRNLTIQRWAWGRADAVLSVSSRLADDLARTIGFPRQRIRVIRNGIDTRRFHPQNRGNARRAFGLVDGDLVLGSIGRLVAVKDHATFVDSLASLRSRGRRCKALVAGDGPLMGALRERVAAHQLAEDVSFLGNRPDIHTVLAACDIFVLTSTSEGLPNTILEAMATALPVVSTRVGGAEELVDEGSTGFLVTPGNPEAVADAIEGLARDERLRLAMGVAGRRRAVDEFSLETMTTAYENMYGSFFPRRARLAPVSRICAE